MDGTIGIIGVGNIGEAIVKGFLEAGFKKENLFFSEIVPVRRKEIREKYGIRDCDSIKELADLAEYIIGAIKPQDANYLLKELSPYMKPKNVFISVMAGVTSSRIISLLGQKAKLIRIMPNICVRVREGVIGIWRNEMVEENEFEFVRETFSSLGMVVEIKEELFDAITAFSGSGPAFFLFFLEGMVDAGVRIGFSREVSLKIAEKIIAGTMKIMERENIHPSSLKERITSPGGTTIAGLVELEERAFKGAIIRAIEAAAKRAKELSL